MREYIAANIGKHIEFSLAAVPNVPPKRVSGTLTYFDGQNELDLVGLDSEMKSFYLGQISSLSLKGLTTSSKRTLSTPAIDLTFKVKADHNSKIKILSLEGGAAWNAAYRLDLGAGNATITAKAQLAVAGLRLRNTDAQLLSGMPDIGRSARLDLTTGLTSLDQWLNNQSTEAVPLVDADVDPYSVIAAIARQYPNQYQMGGGFGGGMGGGMGGAPAGVDFLSYNPTDNSLIIQGRATEADRIRFIQQAIQATRTEDIFSYPIGHIDLEPGERLTRILSTSKTPVQSGYYWSLNYLPGSNGANEIRRVLELKNSSSGAWPIGAVFVTRGDLPVAQVSMPFTAAGQSARLDMGTADDLVKSAETKELKREPLDLYRTGHSNRVYYEVDLHFQNTRLEKVPLDIEFQVLGDISAADGAKIEKTAVVQTLENPSMKATWRQDVQPGDKLDLKLFYSVEI
jgi:hypothetical protein